MRTLVIGDIHGGLKALQQALKLAQMSRTDKIVFLGDYVDGWSESPQLLDFLIEFNNTHQCIFIRGNHDDLLCDWLDKGTDNLMWHKHGGESTINAYKTVSSATKQKHVQFLKSLHHYYIDEQNRLFVHAGFSNMNGVEHEYFQDLVFWDRTLWETAMALDTTIQKDDFRYPKRFKLYSEIFIGHTPVTRIGKTTPVNYANVWNIDTGAAFKGVLTIMDIDTKEFWQSQPLPQLYPKEIGRNS